MNSSQQELIDGHAMAFNLPDGAPGRVISLEAVASISEQLARPGWRVEAEALAMRVIPCRYLRNMSSITADMQKSLLRSRVAQVGLGGLGGTLLEILLRTGIGRIRAADGDSFEESNLNRQALSNPSNLGMPKAEAAIHRCTQINPSVELDAKAIFLTTDTLPAFVKHSDVVIDALGGLQTRLALQKAASDAAVPMVTGALAGWTGYVSVVLPGAPGPAEIMGSNNAAEEQLGCPASAVTWFASLMATEAIKLLTGEQSPLAGKMLVADLNALSFDMIRI